MLSRLFPLLLLCSVIELTTFISLSFTIGFFYTLLTLLVLSYLGFLFKRLCRRYPQILLSTIDRSNNIASMGELFVINIAQTFLIIPTFITKILGILLFIPAIRRWAIKQVIPKNFSSKKASKEGKTINLDPDNYKNIN